MSYNLSGAINCTIYRNGDSLGHPQQMSIPGDLTMKQLLEKCSLKLGMNARRVFQIANGEEILYIHMIAPDESLIITEGDEVNPNLLKNYHKQSYKRSSDNERVTATFNLAIIGPASVGKSSIVVRYIYNSFSAEYVPTVQDQYSKNERIDDDLYCVNILDTSGTEDFFSLIQIWMLNKDALILAYSVEDKEHFNTLQKLNQNVKHYDQNNEIPKVVVANKSDVKKRKVTTEEGKAFADSMGAPYFETSAKLDKNITEVFQHLVMLLKDKKKAEIKPVVQQNYKKGQEGNVERQQRANREPEEKASFMSWIFSKCNLI